MYPTVGFLSRLNIVVLVGRTVVPAAKWSRMVFLLRIPNTLMLQVPLKRVPNTLIFEARLGKQLLYREENEISD